MIAKKAKYSDDATIGIHDPIYMPVKKHPNHNDIARRNTVLAHDDPILETYKVIGGKGMSSCLIYCVDATNWGPNDANTRCDMDIVFIVKYTLFSDMDRARYDHYQSMLRYLHKDTLYRGPLKSNCAKVGTFYDEAIRSRDTDIS